MKILIFGGTTEGKLLAGQLAKLKAEITVSNATVYGSEEYSSVRVLTGRLGEEEMEQLVQHFDLCIDATHPFALEATANIKKACAGRNVPYLRLLRRRAHWDRRSVITVNDAQEAAALLEKTEGNILLTTGSRDLKVYARAGARRIYPRVLPLEQSLAACREAGIPARNIIAMQGPFSEELNTALIREFSIRILVTKESGEEGGFPAKLESAKKNGVIPVVIARPEEEGFTLEEIVRICRQETEAQ